MDLMDLFIKIGVDSGDAEKGLANLSQKASTAGDVLKGSLASAAIQKGFSVIADGAKKGAEAIYGMVKSSVDAYADFEQLQGGAKLMFGEVGGGYDYIMGKAKNAYKTVQMSANDYLTQANGFAVGLKTSLGGNGEAAAELADKIITAEADIVAATGNSAENVQNAFNGIMKSNYTMLDNLQIGITPTKEGMQEVIDKVNEYNATQGNATNYTIDNLADVQSALVQYVSMVGMSGYAAGEASDTIQGSLASTKAAWENLLTAFANGEDISSYIDALVQSATGLAENIVPVVGKALEGIGQLVEKAAPIISEKLPEFISEVLPSLVDAASTLIDGLAENLPSIIEALAPAITETFPIILQAIVDTLPQLIETAVTLVTEFAAQLPDIINIIVDALPEIVTALWDGFTTAFDGASAPAKALIASILGGVVGKGILDVVPTIVSFGGTISDLAQKFSVAKSVTDMMGPAFSLMGSGILPVIGIIAAVIAAIVAIIAVIKNWGAITEWLGNLWNKVSTGIGNMASKVASTVSSAWNSVKQKTSEIWGSMASTISSAGSSVYSAVSGIFSSIRNTVSNVASEALNWGADIVSNIASGIRGAISKVTSAVASVADNIKSFLGFSEPEEGPLSDFHTYMPDMMNGLAHGMYSNMNVVRTASSDVAQAISSGLSGDTGTFGIRAINSPSWLETLQSGALTGSSGGFNQEVNIYAPEELSPSEIARQTRNATRNMVLALRGE